MKKHLIILLVFISFSCGTKKKIVAREKENVVEIEKKEVDVKIANDIETNTLIIETDKTITITPANPKEDMVFNGQTSKNAVITINKSHKKEATKTTDQSKTEVKIDSESKKKSEKSTRHVDLHKTGVQMPWYVWLILVIFFILLILWVIRKIRK